MAETIFSREAGRDLYSVPEGAPGLPRTRYLLRRANPSLKDQLTLSETWPGSPETDGFYLFLDRDLAPGDEASLARQLRAADFAAGTRFLWVSDTAGVFNATIRVAVRTGTTAAPVAFALGNIRLELDTGCTAAVNEEQDGFVFAPAEGAQIRFRMRAGGEPLAILRPPVTLSLAGPAAGAPGFSAGVDQAQLAEMGGDLRYFYLREGEVEELRYALFTLPAGRILELDAWLDPFRPREAGRTRFGIRGAADPLEGCFATPAGQAIALRPLADAALVLCARPAAGSYEYYLAPSGSFGVPAGVELMCGLQGTEYVRPGGRIRFVPGMPAFAPTFPERAEDSSQVLLDTREGTATTAWMLPQDEGTPAGYFAQPAAAAYFGRANATWSRLTEVVPVRVADYDAGAGVEGQPPLPAVPYAAATVRRGGLLRDGSEWSALAEFEEQVLAPNRWRVAPFLSRPRFAPGEAPEDRVALRAASGAPTVITPQGFLAVLNEDGSQRELVLARSADGTQRLWFEAPSQPGVAAALQLALLSSEVFLVVSRSYPEMGTFHSRYDLGGFTFDLAPAVPGESELRTILIFKFRDLALADLVSDVNLWTAPQAFNDKVPGAQAVAAADRYPVQDTLRQIIRDAEASADPNLQDFVRHVVNDPSWRGVLALNARVAGLRPELEGIRGGMTQPLVGHHVGIELNQVTTDPAEITASSLFGLISYPPAPPAAASTALRLHRPAPFRAAEAGEPADQDFVVDELTVVFRNSDVVDFRCAISLILNRMFGRPVERVPPGDNRLRIAGAYQSHGDVGSFALASAETVLLRTTGPEGSPRVLRYAGVQGAQFVTTAKEPVESKPGISRVSGRFVLTGGLGFAPDVFPVAPAADGAPRPPLDLFGYGGLDGSTLLPYDGLRLDYSFEMDASGDVVAGSRTPLRMDAAQVAFTPAPAGALRPGSFVAGLPLQLVGLRYDPDGLRGGGKAVQVPALGDRQTRTPHYALEFQLPLGSLGSMSTVGASLSAGVLVGWGPSETVADDDAAALLVNLPALTPGVAGYSFQGVLRTTFGDGNLARFLPAGGAPGVRDEVYALLFNNVALSLFGITLPPGVVLDFALFADPRAGGAPSLSNLGWYLAYAQDTDP